MKTAKQLELLLEDAQELEAHLPPGWAMARIGDIAASEPRSLTDGPFGSNLKTSHYTEAGPRVIRLQNIGDGEFVDARAHISPDHFEKLRQHQALAEDVLIAMLGENLPRACLVPESLGPAIVKADCARLRVAAPSISPAFVMYALNAPQTRKFASALIHGVGRPRLGLGLLRELPVPLAPTREQIRLSEAVDSYLSRLDDAIVTLERVQRNLKRYSASVLKAAVEGRLVPTEAELARQEGRDYEPADVLLAKVLEERKARWIEQEAAKGRAKAEAKAIKAAKSWNQADDNAALAKARAAATKKYKEPARPDTSRLPELPEAWCWATFEMIAEQRLGKMLDKAKNQGELRPYLRNANVRWFGFDLSDVAEMRITADEFAEVSAVAGDLVVCEGGEPGRCAVWTDDAKSIAIQKALHRVRPFGSLSPSYLASVLAADAENGRLSRSFTGSTIKHFTGEALRAYVVPLPPLVEQQSIVAEIEDTLSLVDAVDRQVDANLRRLQRLRQSILRWAFEGKLVDQDPNDESASLLLDRIKAEREAGRAATKAKKKPGRSKRKKKSA